MGQYNKPKRGCQPLLFNYFNLFRKKSTLETAPIKEIRVVAVLNSPFKQYKNKATVIKEFGICSTMATTTVAIIIFMQVLFSAFKHSLQMLKMINADIQTHAIPDIT